MSTATFQHPHFLVRTSEHGETCTACANGQLHTKTWRIRGFSGRFCDKHFNEITNGLRQDDRSEAYDRRFSGD